MWLATKEAARKKPLVLPSDKMLHDELGLEGAIHYKRLIDRFEDSPEAARGPDEPISDHYSRMKSTLDRERAEYERDNPNQHRPRDDVKEQQPTKTPGWLLQRQKEQEESVSAPPDPESAPSARPLSLPARDPGWYTSPETQSRGYGVPPMSRRTPGDTMRPANGPGYAPDSQLMGDWVQWLKGKGIDVNHALERPNAARPEDMGPQLTRSQQIWHPFVDQAPRDTNLRDLPEDQGGFGKSWKQRARDLFGGRKASVTVTDYIEKAVTGMNEG